MSGQLSPNTTELRKLFEAAEQQIENNLFKITAKAKATKKYMTTKRREVRKILSELKKGAFEWTDKSIPTYYKRGVGDGIQELGLSGALATGALHKQTITALSEGLNNRFADVTGLIGRRVDDIYRTVQLERAVSTSMGYNSVKQAAARIREDLATRGINGFVDKAGRRWNMATYADMAARTVAAEATRRGKWNEFIEHGEDLVRVSNHSTQCELCAPWEDEVLSITGKTQGYPTVNDAMAAGLFHPNCQHSTSLAVSEILKEEEKREREKDVREFIPAETIEEANAFAQSLGIAKHVDYLGVDLDVANEFNKRLVWYRDNVKPELLNMEYFGTDSGRVKFRLKRHDEWAKTALKDKSIWPVGFTLKQKKAFLKAQRDKILLHDELPARAMAGYNVFDEAIIFKEGCFFSKDRILEIARCDKGFVIVGDNEGITATLDHEIGHALDFRSKPRISSDSVVRQEWESFKGSKIPEARKNLSEYALDNQEEFIAESWAEFMNHKSPREIANRVGARVFELVRRNP